LAPQALRDAGIADEVRALGHQWTDYGDLPLPSRGRAVPPEAGAAPAPDEAGQGARLRFAAEVSQACEQIAQATEEVARADAEAFVLTVGGDHALALGSVAGIQRARPAMALIWVDSHGDFNT